MEDELQILRGLFETQNPVIQNMLHLYASDEEINTATSHGEASLEEALARLRDYTGQATEMLNSIRRTRRYVSQAYPTVWTILSADWFFTE